MTRIPILKKATTQLFNNAMSEAKRLKEEKSTELEIKLSKELFDEDVWDFLVKEEENFRYPFQALTGSGTYIDTLMPVYSVWDNNIKTTEREIFGIRNNYIGKL